MNSLFRRVTTAALVGALYLAATASCFALGFRNPDQNAAATGQGEAFVAQADDASAIYYNPAGLTQLHGSQVSGGGYLFLPDYQFSGVAGKDDMENVSITPHFYAASDFGLQRWRFGIGANIPFGNQTDWGHSGPFVNLVTSSKLIVYDISPTAAFQVNDHLSVGAALNFYRGQTELDNQANPNTGGGNFRFKGDGEAIGATAGVLWKINGQHSLGAVYRSPFTITFADAAVIHKNAFLGTIGPESAHAAIDFPQSVAAGYAFRPNAKLKLEADIEWTNWDTLNTVHLRSKNGTFNNNLPFNWQDSFFYEFGAQYEFIEHWFARAGYIFSENTVPGSAFSPNVPDSNRHVLSAGLGYHHQRISFDCAYQYTLSNDRTVKNSAFVAPNGKWTADSHALMLTSSVKF